MENNESTKEITTEEILKKNVEGMNAGLEKLNLGKAAIEKLKADYGELKITDLTDVVQYNKVHEALQVVKKTRIGIEKYYKGGRDFLNKYVKTLSTDEKSLVEFIDPLEQHLFNERKKVDDEKERIANEEKLAFDNKMNARIKALGEFGKVIDFADAVAMDDAGYENTLEEAKIAFEQAEAKKKEEAEALEKQKEEQKQKELELQKQQEEQKQKEEEQKKKEKELQDKQDKLNEDKFILRLGMLSECTFNGTSLYLYGELFATRQELIELEEDRFHTLKKTYTDKVKEKTHADAKAKELEIENAKKEEAERLQKAEDERKEKAKNDLILTRYNQLQKYAPDCFELSQHGRELLGNMTEDEFTDHLNRTKTSYEKTQLGETRYKALSEFNYFLFEKEQLSEMPEGQYVEIHNGAKNAFGIDQIKKADALKSDSEKLEKLACKIEEITQDFPTLESTELDEVLSYAKETLEGIAKSIREKSKIV